MWGREEVEYERQNVVEANHKLNRLFGEGKRDKRHASITCHWQSR